MRRFYAPACLELRVDVAAWLQGLGLGRYEQAFREHDVDSDVLGDLDDHDLEKLGVSLGDRKRLLKALAAFRPTPSKLDERAAPQKAERRQLTVMFVDLVGSTALAGLDPEEMGEVLRDYLDMVAAGIDASAATSPSSWATACSPISGWRKAHEDDAERAVRAASRSLRR